MTRVGDTASAAKWLSETATGAAGWLGTRLADLALWPVNLVRDVPGRAGRLGLTLVTGLRGLVVALPGAVRAVSDAGAGGLGRWASESLRRTGRWAVTLLMQVLDIFGIPELLSFAGRALTRTSPLTGAEIMAASMVLGPEALRYHDVRIAQGGVLRPIFRRNRERAFTTFHTINLPERGRHSRRAMDVVVHELVHVYQYEKLGSPYIWQCLLAQRAEGYGYGGVPGLARACEEGRRYCDFNLEQQAAILQDYFKHLQRGDDVESFEPFVTAARRGQLRPATWALLRDARNV